MVNEEDEEEVMGRRTLKLQSAAIMQKVSSVDNPRRPVNRRGVGREEDNQNWHISPELMNQPWGTVLRSMNPTKLR